MSDLEHYDREIYELDERIGRLALLCGADLSRQDVVVSIIAGRFEVCTRLEALSVVRRNELRGLLMLKYKIQAECSDTLGGDDCARLVAEQDALLRQRGFSPQNQARQPRASAADADSPAAPDPMRPSSDS